MSSYRCYLVYRIKNLLNGKVYFGITSGYRGPIVALRSRWRDHCWDARSGKRNGRLHRAIRKYGEGVFAVEIVIECVDQIEAWACERAQIAQAGSMQPAIGYNMSSGAEKSAKTGGRRHSEETRAKIGAANRGRTFNAEVRAKLSAAHRGLRQSPEHRAKLTAVLTDPSNRLAAAAALKGRIFSPEHRASLSIAQRRNAADPVWRKKQMEGARRWRDERRKAAAISQ